MRFEKVKFYIARFGWLLVSVFCLVMVFMMDSRKPSELDLINDACYITDYYESLDETNCELELTFNTAVTGGDVTVDFYDAQGNLIETKTAYGSTYGSSDGQTVSCSFFEIEGNVDAYEIVSYDLEFDDGAVVGFAVLFGLSIMLMLPISFRWSYRQYRYGAYTVSVYCGFVHHTLRVNGQLCDEHTTPIFLTPIYLSTVTDTGEEIVATVSIVNRCSLKIDGKLVKR